MHTTKIILALTLVGLSGCFNSQPADGSLKCSSASPACPSGYYCAGDNTCWHNGHGDGGIKGGKHQGDACQAATECDTTHCVDGVCCETTCEGQCEACDLPNSMGVCGTVPSGPPHASHMPCAGGGTTCQGMCDGSSPTTCVFPGVSTHCGASCDGTCDGTGVCSSSSVGGCPGGFACGASGCLTSCSAASDCQLDFQCVGSSCVRNVESDCLDGVDNNGDGLADCQDPTCNAQVECVVAPSPSPAGATFGVLVPLGSPCPSVFPTAVAANRGLPTNTPCDNCQCFGTATCTYAVTASSSAGCASSTVVGNLIFTGWPDPEIACLTIPTQSTGSIGVASSGTAGSPSCVAHYGYTAGQPANATPMWRQQDTFCAISRSSYTCGNRQICVPQYTRPQPTPSASPSPTASPSPAPLAVCLQLGGAGATCPSGYQALVDNSYTGFTDTRSCSSCTCGAATGTPSCDFDNDEAYGSTSCPNSSSSSSDVTLYSCENISTTVSVVYGRGYDVIEGISCGAPTRSGTGSVVGNGGSTLCCPGCSCDHPPCLDAVCKSGQFCDGAACNTCNTPQFCGASCTTCLPLGDTCQNGSSCRCGNSSSCDSRYADSCSAGACKCGSNVACSSNGLGGSQTCTKGNCMCGTTVCDPTLSDGCFGSTGSPCSCGTGPACTGGQTCSSGLGIGRCQ